MQTKTIFSTVLVATFILGSAFCNSVSAQAGTKDSSSFCPMMAMKCMNMSSGKISVTGEAEITLQPDQIYIRIGVDERNSNARDVHKKVMEEIGKVLDYLRKRKDIKELKTTSVRLQTVNDYQTKETSYSGHESLSFVLLDMKAYDDVILQLIDMGINNIEQVSFQSSKAKEQQEALLKQAVENARKKATVLAGELGQKVGKAIYISDTYSSSPEPVPMYKMAALSSDSGSSVEGGDIKLSATVNVEFELK